jgi:hypothetical protein
LYSTKAIQLEKTVVRGLPLLIALARTDADERRAELGRIMAVHRAAQDALAAHDRAAAEEARASAASPAARAAYAAWLRTNAARRLGLEEQRRAFDRTEHAAYEALRDSVAALKRLETAARTAATAARREGARRAAARADELQVLRGPQRESAD